MLKKLRIVSISLTVALLGLAQLLALPATLIYFLPVSLRPFQNQLNRLTGREFGLRADWSAGHVWVRRRQLLFRNLRVYRIGQAQSDFQFGRVRLRFDAAIGAAPRWRLTDVQLANPTPVTLLLTESGVQFDPPVIRLARQLAAARDRRTRNAEEQSAWPALRLINGQFVCGQLRDQKTLPVCSLTGIELNVSREAARPVKIAFDGHVLEQQGREFQGAGDFDPVSGRGVFELRMNQLELPLYLPGERPAQTTIENGTLAVHLQTLKDRGVIRLSAGAETIEGKLDATRLRFAETKPRLQLSANFDAELSQLLVDELRYQSAETDLRSSGSLAFIDGFAVEGAARVNRLNDCWRQLLPAAAGIVAAAPGASAGWIELRGGYTAPHGAPPDFRAVLELHDRRLDLPYLPLPLENITGAITADPAAIECTELRASYGGDPLTLALRADSALLRGRRGRASARWRLNTRLDLFCEILRQAALRLAHASGREIHARLSECGFGGGLKLNGSAQLAWPDAPRLEDFEIKLESRLALSQGWIKHPALPAPVERIDGVLRGTNERLEIENLSGESQGLTVQINGALHGDQFLWNAPQLELNFASQLQLPQMLGDVPVQSAEWLRFYQPRGELKLALDIKGPLLRPLDLQVSSYADLKDFSIDPPFNWIIGRLTGINGRIALRHGSIHAEDLQLRLGDVEFTVNADARRAELTLDVATRAGLDSLPQTLPIFFNGMQMAGNVRGFTQLRLRRAVPDAPAPPAAGDAQTTQQLKMLTDLLAGWITDLRAKPPPLTGELHGRYELHDVTATPQVFPQPIRALNGVVHGENFRFYSKELTGMIGSSRIDAADVEFLLRPPNLPRIDLRLETPLLALDDWITNWIAPPPFHGYFIENSLRLPGNADRYTTANLDADWQQALLNEPRELELNLLLDAERVTWKQYAGGRFSGRLRHLGRNNAPSVLSISDVNLDFYQGLLDYATTLTFRPERPADFAMSIKPQGVDLSDFLGALNQKPVQIKGTLFGEADLAGTFNDLDMLTGSGLLEIRNSQLLSIVFTELYKLLNLIPGYSYYSFSRIVAPFTLAERKVHFDNLKFEGPLIDIQARGDYYLDKTLDFLVLIQINNPAPGLFDLIILKQIAEFVGKAFSYHLKGTLDKPEYEYVPFSYVRGLFKQNGS